MFIRRSTIRRPRARNGWLAPIMALVLFVMLGLFALVLDRLWLDMATAEAQGVAESAALAAARELPSDDLLKVPAPNPDDRIERAKEVAINVAQLNTVAAQPLMLSADQGDIQFGSNLVVEDTGEIRFVESNYEVHSVRVVAQRTRTRRNPVALFFGGLTKLPEGDVAAMAEATISNQIVGLQTVSGARIPALPLAILARAPEGSSLQTWYDQIELRRGADRYGYDSAAQAVVSIQDGIPEIILTAPATGSEITTSNMRLFCIHGQQDGTTLEDEIRQGWGDQHLAQRDGRILLNNTSEYFPAAQSVPSGCLMALKEMIGQSRIVLLFQDEWATDTTGWGRIQSAGLVAGRIMAVIEEDGQSPQIVFQPSVLATRCAMLASDLNDPGTTSSAAAPVASSQAAPANKYIYQFKLTQ